MARKNEVADDAKILIRTSANLRRQAADLLKESHRLRTLARKLREKRRGSAVATKS